MKLRRAQGARRWRSSDRNEHDEPELQAARPCSPRASRTWPTGSLQLPGRFHINSITGKGTTVVGRIPLDLDKRNRQRIVKPALDMQRGSS